MHVWIQVFCVIYFYLLAIISQKKNNMLKNYHERFLSTRPMFFRTCIQKLCYQQSRSVFFTLWCQKIRNNRLYLLVIQTRTSALDGCKANDDDWKGLDKSNFFELYYRISRSPQTERLIVRDWEGNPVDALKAARRNNFIMQMSRNSCHRQVTPVFSPLFMRRMDWYDF